MQIVYLAGYARVCTNWPGESVLVVDFREEGERESKSEGIKVRGRWRLMYSGVILERNRGKNGCTVDRAGL